MGGGVSTEGTGWGHIDDGYRGFIVLFSLLLCSQGNFYNLKKGTLKKNGKKSLTRKKHLALEKTQMGKHKF